MRNKEQVWIAIKRNSNQPNTLILELLLDIREILLELLEGKAGGDGDEEKE